MAFVHALRSRYVWLGIALLVGCGGPAAIAFDDAGAEDPADGGMEPEAPPPTCELAQAPLARPAEASTVLVTPRSIFIGDARGLWRSSDVDGRFERVTSMPGDSRAVVTLVGVDDGAIFAVLGEGRVLTSSDDGERWEELVELPPTGGVTAPRLHTDGERVVGTVARDTVVQALYDLDRATGEWIEIVASEPVEGWGHSGVVLVGIDDGALLATPSGYRSGGLFRLERGAARWERVEGLDDDGYTTFARRGDVAVVANARGIWAEIEGAYQRVLARELGRPLVVSTADGFVGIAADGVLRSSDGVAWEVEPFADGASRLPVLLSESGGRVAALRGTEGSVEPRFVSLSEDRGATWREPSIVSQSFERVSTHGEGERRISYVSPYAWWPYQGFSTWRSGAWASFSWELPYGASAVAMTETGAWGCSSRGCAHRTDDGEVGPQIAMPESPFAHEPTTAFATSHGLFVSPRSYGTSCGAVQPGLVVLRDEGEWEDASAGLRSWAQECAGTPSVATVSTMLEEGGVLWATQSRQYARETFEPVVLRSIDGGRSWREVREGAELVALVRAEAGAYGLFRPGVIEALDAAGEAFAPVAAQPGGGEVVDIVALDGRLVAATAEEDGAGLWLSDDGARTWEPLVIEARIGPIGDLDVHGSVLGIASRTSGLWEASSCFAR